jgi:hypothetical protein
MSNTKEWIMENKRVYIVLTRTNTILSRLIGVLKNDEYTHASISLNKNIETMYSFGRRYQYNPFIGRFVKENLNEGVFGLQKSLKGLVMEIEVTSDQYDKINQMLNEFIINKNHYKYNYLGLIYSLLNLETCRNDRFLCSEFVYYLLNECGAVNFNKPRNLVRPQDFLQLKGRVIYRGNLKDDVEIMTCYRLVEI